MASPDLKGKLPCFSCHNPDTHLILDCGHDFCRNNLPDTQQGSLAHCCPWCKVQHTTLWRDITLLNIAEHFQARREEEDCEVYCTYCVHTSVVASKTCLLCEASLCDVHLTVHSKSQEHVLIQPSKSFRSKKCPYHQKVLMYYCTDDAECLCVSCCLGEKHRGHQVQLLNEASKKKQEKLRTIKGDIIKEKEEIEKRVQSLQDRLNHIPEKEAGILEKVSIQFRELRMKLENLENHVVNEISKNKEQVSLSVSDLIQKLEKKKNDLSQKISTLEELCQVKEPLHCLQANLEDLPDLVVDNNTNMKKTVADDLAEDSIIQAMEFGMVNIMSGLQRGYYVQGATGILLDVNTASNNLRISDDLKTASWTSVNQGRPQTPERFEDCKVLSMNGFSEGRLYWDVEVSREGAWRVGMTYPSVERKAEYSYFGNSLKSWSLHSDSKQYSVRQNRKDVTLSCRPTFYKVRMYLDYTAGQLSFYELGNPMRHLYTYSATFTEALYPMVAVWNNAWVRVLN